MALIQITDSICLLDDELEEKFKEILQPIHDKIESMNEQKNTIENVLIDRHQAAKICGSRECKALDHLPQIYSR